MTDEKIGQDEERILKEVSNLKKDVYFSYLINLNNRYIYQEMYEKIERLFYIKNILNKYNVEIDELDRKTNINKVIFTNEELKELKDARRAKEISLFSIRSRVKGEDGSIRQVEYKKKISNNYKYIIFGLTIVYLMKGFFLG